ncbi:thiamine pyrophosphokinase [Staphylotrichum tortipilum]|uniref:Thiamine pyrophosphokinase n=1 Tax=Staphylotrichum tortipilum TaxID=2831512 RepID=A0AAN6RVZ2_9PEZI|nr:thiamine pyrophosphokinase [Staphylotrichum longicolle]
MATSDVPTNPGPSDLPEFEWRPADLIRRRRPSRPAPPEAPKAGAGAKPDDTDEHGPGGFALVVLNQPLHPHLGLVHRLWDNAYVRVAADGGANCLYQAAGIHGDPCFDDLDTIIGDLDSLSPETRRYYESLPSAACSPSSPSASPPPRRAATQILLVEEQDSTDFAKAVAHVRQESHPQHQHYLYHHPPPPFPPRGGTPAALLDVVALGGLGGRVDQGVSQLHHLFLFQAGDAGYARGRVFLFSGESLTWLLKPGRHRIRVRDGVFGKHVGILPVGGPSVISTRGLEWDVREWHTEFGGRVSTSNHVLPETEVVEVETTREVLFTIALREV